MSPSARPLIDASWRRVAATGLDPGGREVALLPAAEVQRRVGSGPLAAMVPVLRSRLGPVAEACGQLLVVVDVDGRVLWGCGIHPSIVTSSLRAVVSAVDRARGGSAPR